MDLAIALVAWARGAQVATANLKHFRLVPGLEIVDWSAGGR